MTIIDINILKANTQQLEWGKRLFWILQRCTEFYLVAGHVLPRKICGLLKGMLGKGMANMPILELFS